MMRIQLMLFPLSFNDEKKRILLNTTLIKCRGKQSSCWLHYNKLNPCLKFIVYLVCNQQTYCYSTFHTLATSLLLLQSLIMWLFCAKLISWGRGGVEKLNYFSIIEAKARLPFILPTSNAANGTDQMQRGAAALWPCRWQRRYAERLMSTVGKCSNNEQ